MAEQAVAIARAPFDGKDIIARCYGKGCDAKGHTTEAMPAWSGEVARLKQVHGTTLAEYPQDFSDAVVEGDILFTKKKNVLLVLATADCVPIFIYSQASGYIGLVHAGWRGLCAGVIERASQWLVARGVRLEQCRVWIGPHIGFHNFVVGKDVFDQLVHPSPGDSGYADGGRSFCGRYYVSLYALCVKRLLLQGYAPLPTVATVGGIYGGEHDTYSQPSHWYSYRRGDRGARLRNCIGMMGG